MQFIGGDIMCGLLLMMLGIYGFVLVGWVLKCFGVKLGDWIYVIGMLGDSVVGLVILWGDFCVGSWGDVDYLVKCYLCLMLCIL